MSPFVDPVLVRSRKVEGEPDKLPVWVKSVDDAFRAGLAGREDEMRSGFDTVREFLQAATPLYSSAKADDDNDLRGQLEAVRRQARWYEAEWQKARARAESTRAKLDAMRQSKRVPATDSNK